MIDILDKIFKMGYIIVYLTSRSIIEYDQTRKYLSEIKSNIDKSLRLPPGPILMYPYSFISSLKNDFVTKQSNV